MPPQWKSRSVTNSPSEMLSRALRSGSWQHRAPAARLLRPAFSTDPTSTSGAAPTSRPPRAPRPEVPADAVKLRMTGLPMDWTREKVQDWLKPHGDIYELNLKAYKAQVLPDGKRRQSRARGTAFAALSPPAADSVLALNETTPFDDKKRVFRVSKYVPGLKFSESGAPVPATEGQLQKQEEQGAAQPAAPASQPQAAAQSAVPASHRQQRSEQLDGSSV